MRYILGLWISAVIVAAFWWVQPAVGFVASGNMARIMIFHVPAAMTTVICFAVGTWFAGKNLVLIKRSDETKMVVAFEIAMLFGVLATVTGSLFAYYQWGSAWNWDPRETSMLGVLLMYAAFFALRGGIADADKRAMVSSAYAIIAFIPALFLLFVVPRIPELRSIHPSTTLWDPKKLDIAYKVTLYSAFVGYIWLFVRMFRAQVGVALVEAALEDKYARLQDKNISHIATAPRVVRNVPVSTADRSAGEASGEANQ